MKFKHLVILSIATMITAGCATEVTSNETDTQTPIATTLASPVAESGNFQAAEHPTQGKVSVVKEAGKSYLEFDQNFQTDNGPDLFVILHRSATPPVSGIQEKDYVSIAALQNISGTQRYAVPDNVNLADFKSVAIWCRQFNATFGYASL
ncbi:DM13 domain-containing protein [Nodularia sp. UHCC 0506]|uniref:DM13 domain-containing protein n=1 Tax=Nodularia sp. UHCC 0506 TaxID=3110243 RepID=UPI002B1F4F0A|nr:DM13 domain-containing protein [Nodularia sp. UHCC 0506]MEA5513006.1 DM13 domain-containing protein [Nodularia sp. UHCC 0506]